jgi:SP family general alpha glucoside:H+ symporter-like MFS transporter
VWVIFRMPETKGRTFEELDLMFAAKVSTRKFAKYKVDAYEGERGGVLESEEKENNSNKD